MNRTEGSWVKNWVMKASMLFDSLYGKLYTDQLEGTLGKSLDYCVLSYEDGMSTNYLLKSDIDGFGKYLAEQVIKNNNIAKDWSKQVIKQTDEIMEIISELEQKIDFDRSDLDKIKQSLYSHVAPNFAMKKVIDYLPEDLSGKLIEDFEGARLHSENVYPSVEGLIEKICREISIKNNYDQDSIRCMTYDEYISYFNTGLLPKEEILLGRKNRTILWYQRGRKYEIYTGKKASETIKNIAKPESSDIIKGMPAHKGLVSGIVRVVLDPKNIKRFDEGNILVTGMTRPDFLPLMKKSGAFVTDAGGLLSHAAITARELKKPCIVGTEIATKLLKDGDVVEVDADKGIVKILGGK